MRCEVSESWGVREHGIGFLVQYGSKHLISRLEPLHLRPDLLKVIRCRAVRDRGNTLARQIVGPIDRASDLLGRQDGRQLRGIERYKDHACEHPEKPDDARQPKGWHFLHL